MTRILVIRLSAFGDFVLSFGPYAAIRAHHPSAEITLLTTAPYAELARAAPWFDRVEIDARPAPWNLPGLWRLRSRLRGHDFAYDLQTSARTGWYFRLAGRPPWSGNTLGCSHRQGPAREAMHTVERQRDQLAQAGISEFPRPDLGFLTRRQVPGLPVRFCLLAPGAAPSRPAKRWPAAGYAALAVILMQRGLTPVVIGSAAEADLGATIRASCPQAVDLTGRTAIADIFAIAARATLAVGNDTGPMHLAAAVGCPAVVLFSADSDPALTAPRLPDGGWPVVLRVPVLADLSAARVASAIPSGA